MFKSQKAFIYYLSVIVTIIVNIKNTQQYNNSSIIINQYLNLVNNVTCDIPNEIDKGICIVINKCEAYKEIKKNSFDITPERVNFMKSVQCFNNNYGDNNYTRYEPKVCCPKNLKFYKNPELSFKSQNSYNRNNFNYSKKSNIKKQKRRIEKVQNPLLSSSSSGILNNECGKQITNRIFGGEIAELDEFPWMALIMYNTSTKIKCYTYL